MFIFKVHSQVSFKHLILIYFSSDRGKGFQMKFMKILRENFCEAGTFLSNELSKVCTIFLEPVWDCYWNFFLYDFGCFDVNSNPTDSWWLQKGYKMLICFKTLMPYLFGLAPSLRLAPPPKVFAQWVAFCRSTFSLLAQIISLLSVSAPGRLRMLNWLNHYLLHT